MMAVGAAVICLFFVSPSLPALLIVGPVAMAGPLVALFSRPQSRDQGALAWGAFALAFLLSLILNRNLRRQFALTAQAESLNAERETSLARAEKLARSKSALVETLSHEIRNGLTGVIHMLAASAGQSPRAAPSRAQISAALAAATDLVGVLDVTLDSETAEAGALEIGTTPFDPVIQVRELAQQARAQSAEQGLEFTVSGRPGSRRPSDRRGDRSIRRARAPDLGQCPGQRHQIHAARPGRDAHRDAGGRQAGRRRRRHRSWSLGRGTGARVRALRPGRADRGGGAGRGSGVVALPRIGKTDALRIGSRIGTRRR